MGLLVEPAGANGRFPAADQLVVNPSNPQHLVVRTTFGFLETRSAGANWNWICEEIVGRIGTGDLPLALTGDGTIVVAVPFEGVAVSHDHGCSWSRVPAPLADQLVVDMTVERSDPASVLVFTSTGEMQTDGGSQFMNFVFGTNDHGQSWSQFGPRLRRDFIGLTIETAPSDRNRILPQRDRASPRWVIERSDDRGQTWTRTTIPVSADTTGIFISAVDPTNPDRLWVRVERRPTENSLNLLRCE